MSRLRIHVLILALILPVSCNRKKEGEGLEKLTAGFVFASLALSPVAATAAGYHEHNEASLDEQLDDLSAAGIGKQRGFYQAMRTQLAAVPKDSLSPSDRTDLEIMQDLVASNLLELDSIQSYKYNPTLYVELIGNALFAPYVLEYAPKADRMQQITARLLKIPAFLDTARKNLAASPELWTRVAREENEGNIALIDKIREGVSKNQQSAYNAAAAKAQQALKDFDQWLASDLSQRTADWRLGKARYAQKFRYALGMETAPEQLLRDAEAYLDATRKQMFQLAKPLHASLFPGAPPQDLDTVVKAVLGKISGNHATPGTYLADARRDLDEARNFVKDRNLIALPRIENLYLIETPEFMRGIYGVGGFNPAPALEPEQGAYYWITPIPESWPEERVESKLREYNTYGLKLLTLHEAMPGHYVQTEYANAVQPRGRRVLRSVYGNTPYIEGWAVFATETMLDEGYLNNSPELRLTFLKQQLRVAANAILDVRLHTMGMTDAEAMQLMVDRGFQEQEEASAKLQRAKLSSAQLPTYYAGYREWVKINQEIRKRKGSSYSLSAFNQRALSEGAVPMRVLANVMKQ